MSVDFEKLPDDGISVELPEDGFEPVVPQRDNYVPSDVYSQYVSEDEKERVRYAARGEKSALDGAMREGTSSVRGRSSNKNTIMRAMTYVLPAVILISLLFYNFGGSWFGSSNTVEKSPLNVEDERYKALLAEREDMAKRLEIATAKMEADKRDADARLERFLASMKADSEKTERERAAREEQLRLEMQKLFEEAMKQKQSAAPVEQIPVKVEPARGSSSATRTFDAVADMTRRREEEAKRLAETKYEPPKGARPGLAAAKNIPAVLQTKLVSLFLEDNKWTVAETTADIELEKCGASADASDGFYLPKGTRFLGVSRADHLARRMFVDIHKIQYTTAELEMKGVMLDRHGSSGLVTRYIDARNQALWSSIVPNMLSAAARAAQTMTDVRVRNEYGDAWTEKAPARTKENILLEGAANTLDDQAALLAQINKDKPNLIIVDAPLAVQIQPTEMIPLEKLLEAGIVLRRKR